MGKFTGARQLPWSRAPMVPSTALALFIGGIANLVHCASGSYYGLSYYSYSYAAIDCWDCDGYGCNGRESWVGDGLCDDGRYGSNFWCSKFDMDGGDCKETVGHYFDYAYVRTCVRVPAIPTRDFVLTPFCRHYVDFHYFYEPPTTTTTTPACSDCGGKDCAGNEHWLGDGFCDDKDCKLCNDFNCAEFNYDMGDCEPPSSSYYSATLPPPLRSYYQAYYSYYYDTPTATTTSMPPLVSTTITTTAAATTGTTTTTMTSAYAYLLDDGKYCEQADGDYCTASSKSECQSAAQYLGLGDTTATTMYSSTTVRGYVPPSRKRWLRTLVHFSSCSLLMDRCFVTDVGILKFNEYLSSTKAPSYDETTL